MTDAPIPADQLTDASPATGTPIAAEPSSLLLLTCRVCRYDFRVPAKLTGKKVPCSHCGTQVEVVAVGAKVDPLTGKRLGNCRLTYRLGAGGIGLVYAGDQLSTGRKVAIKMLGAKAGANEVLVQRFQRESKLSAQVNHPNVVQVYDCGFDRGVHFQVMELVEGGTLASLIDEQVRLPWAEAVGICLQITQALVHIHALDIIHRDIKPANILVSVDADGRRLAKLADLGLAKQLDEGADVVGGLTMEGKPLGSPAYMPPEQVRNAKDATRHSDLYGIGASLYAAITGFRPFDGRTGYEVMANVLTKEVVPPQVTQPDLPPALNALILRCLSKDPAKRPASTEVLAQDLEAILATAPPAAANVRPGTAPWRRKTAPSASTVSEQTPPTFGGQEAATGQRPGSASWRRPTAASTPTTTPAPVTPPSPALEPANRRKPASSPASRQAQPRSAGMAPAQFWALIGMGVAIVVLLLVLLLRG